MRKLISYLNDIGLVALKNLGFTVMGKEFNDPIHDQISLNPRLVKIIDTPQFQRLRNIKQLGAGYFVYPGASHNRFEHCIGTAHLAGKLVRKLRKNQPELKISDKDVLCVEMAGLCHDLGHGPFSHLFEKFIRERIGRKEWEHEKQTCKMIDHLIEENNLQNDLAALDDVDDIKGNGIFFVKEMIAGKGNVPDDDRRFHKRSEDKSFLYEIVSNERNKVDVDKWDYFARDCHYLGIQSNFNHNRFMNFIKVLPDEDEEVQICVRDKEIYNLYEMFHTRYMLHRRACQHRVVIAIEIMICDALEIADECITLEGEGGKLCSISQCIDDPVAYTKLNDSIFDMIICSTEDKMKPAREILQRVLKRELYQIVGTVDNVEPVKKEYDKMCSEIAECDKEKRELYQFVGTVDNVGPVQIEYDKMCSEIAECDKEKKMKAEDFVCYKVEFNYGMGESDPISKYKFFSKSDSTKAKSKENVSKMLPKQFTETEFRVLYKPICTDEELKKARDCFYLWCDKKRNIPKEASM